MKRKVIALVLTCLFVAPAVADKPDPTVMEALRESAKVHATVPVMLENANESEEPARTWVFFGDKGFGDDMDRAAALDRVERNYNARALQRRAKRGEATRSGRLVRFTDLPVSEDYIAALRSTGAAVRVVSRWLNAVSVEASAEQLAEIAKMDFVVKMQAVGRRAKPLPPQPTDTAEPALPSAPVPASPTLVDYGVSRSQLEQMNLIPLHDQGYTGAGMIVGILDSGFKLTHEAYNQAGHPLNVIAAYDFVNNDTNVGIEPGDPSDQHSHGTQTLGCLAAYKPGSYVGGCYDAAFVLAKTEDTSQEVPQEEDNFVAGLEFVEMHGADIVTASLGYIDWYTQADLDGLTAVTTIACNTLTANGVVHCNAAGNEYHDTNPTTSSIIAPADGFQVITVGAVSSSGSIASFSSDGPTADGRVKPEILARGVSSNVISSSSDTSYTTNNGTSFATPLAASAITCLMQARPHWSVDQVREALFQTSNYYVANGTFDPQYVLGYGILDVTAATAVCSPAGQIYLDSESYACTDVMEVTVNDCDLNLDPNTVETILVQVASNSDTTGLAVTLTEASADANDFVGMVTLDDVVGAGALLVADGDTITVSYLDANNGAGGVNITVVSLASVDCIAPEITNVTATDIQPRSAAVEIAANENVTATVYYGASCTELDGVAAGATLANPASVSLSGLQDGETQYFAVEAADEAGNVTYDDNGGECYSFDTPEVPDYYTELFPSFDLENMLITFTPNGTFEYYDACIEPITELPTDPAGGTSLALGDDDSQRIALGGNQVSLFGQSYSSVYLGANGFLTFAESDTTYTESLSAHFSKARVAALFDDLHPGQGGVVNYRVLADRFVATWYEVPERNAGNSNTFQIEMYYDGKICIAYLNVGASDGLSGLSAGNGIPAEYYPSDLSALGDCGPKPPIAVSQQLATPVNVPVTVTLEGRDDGLPDPPAALTFTLLSLPSQPLRDMNTGVVIEANDLPYTIGGTPTLHYEPALFFQGSDSFTFEVDDGGAPPEGGVSGAAVVRIVVGGAEVVFSEDLSTDPGWSIEGAWAWGRPTGGGDSSGVDPTSGYTGDYVYGYNLEGDYDNNMTVQSLTTPPIDLSGVEDSQLRFWRWLGVESAAYDHAAIEVSNDGTTWHVVWQHSSPTFSDSIWSQMTVDISAWADNQPTVYIRWNMGPTDNSVTYPGWNIDDIEIRGLRGMIGDWDGDGDVDMTDFAAMPACLTGPGATPYPTGCGQFDADRDNDVDMVDCAIFELIYGQ